MYRAEDVGTRRAVAIKVLHEHLTDDPELVGRFLREGQAGTRLAHPNIVQGITAGLVGGRHYFVMELVDGESLDRVLERRGPLPADEALAIAAQVAKALAHAHAQGMVHRDVKPSNVLITREGNVKVSDLGLARALLGDSSLTQTGGALGTPSYMAPEQARDAGSADARSDIYALGISLYEMLTGERPFRGSTPYAVLKEKEAGAFAPASRLRPGLPAAVDDLLARMLALDPARRPASAGEVLDALERLRTGVAPWPAHRQRQRWRRLAYFAAAVPALLGLLFGMRAALHRSHVAAEHAIADDVLRQLVVNLERGNRIEARRLASERLDDNPGLWRLGRELDAGAVVFLQTQRRDQGRTSAARPLWAVTDLSLSRADNYRFAFYAARACHLYLYQADAHGGLTRVFPNPSYGPAGNPLRPGELLWWPDDSERAWLHLAGEPGSERLYAIVLTRPLRDEEEFRRRLREAPAATIAALQADPAAFAVPGEGRPACFAVEAAEELAFAYR